MAHEMQSATQFWEQLLQTTGGALALEKSFYVATDWTFINGNYKLKSQSTLALSMQLTLGGNYINSTFVPLKDAREDPRNL